MKPELCLFPPVAIIKTVRALEDGANKYGGGYNWRGKKDIKVMTYLSKVLRHVLAYSDGQDNAEDSGICHLAHAMADLAIMLDAQQSLDLIDDRPTTMRPEIENPDDLIDKLFARSEWEKYNE